VSRPGHVSGMGVKAVRVDRADTSPRLSSIDSANARTRRCDRFRRPCHSGQKLHSTLARAKDHRLTRLDATTGAYDRWPTLAASAWCLAQAARLGQQLGPCRAEDSPLRHRVRRRGGRPRRINIQATCPWATDMVTARITDQRRAAPPDQHQAFPATNEGASGGRGTSGPPAGPSSSPEPGNKAC
jgi:hypothetical protein